MKLKKPDKMKLCILMLGHWSHGMGGAQYQVKCFLEQIIPRNLFEIYYLTRNYDEAYSPVGYRIVKIAEEVGLRRYASFLDVFRLLKILNKIKPDYIYQRVACAYTGIASYFAKRNNSQMIWHISSDADLVPLSKSKRLLSPFRYLDRRIFEYGIRTSNHIIAQTYQQANILLKNYNKVPSKVVYNFHPQPFGPIDKTPPIKIIWISNFKPLKQPEVFIKLARDISIREGRVQCVMIGAQAHWNPTWQRSLEGQIKQVKNLSYLGAVNINEVNAILENSHILVNTSQYEGFPNTFIQAWMREVAVVSLNCNPDNVFDLHKVGFVAETYETMLNQVMKLIKNSSLRREIGKRGKAYAHEYHSLKNVSAMLEIVRSS